MARAARPPSPDPASKRPRSASVARSRLQNRWNQLGRSPYPWEQEGLDHIRTRMPQAEPFRAWATFSFTARSGRINECDLFIAVPAGLFLVELKAHPGRAVNRGDTWLFTEQGGRTLPLRNPLHLTNEKTKDLRDRLDWAARQLNLNLRIPMIRPAVFLSAPNLEAHLDEVQATSVYGRDGACRGLPGIWDDLLVRPPERDYWRVTPDLSRKLGDLLATMGVAASTAHLRFGDEWTMRPEVLDAGPTWEDRLADRSGLVSEQGRVRIYLTALQAAEEQRRSVERAARREYQVLQGITHPGIAQALDLREHSGGPAILFRHRENDLRLDSYLDVHADTLTPTTRLNLVRQLAEAVRYAHSRSLYHRALAARSVYVSARDDGTSPILRIIDWQSAARDSDATSATSISASSLPGRHSGDAGVYLAPESSEQYADPGDLDIFGLGAVTYLILTGQPPAVNRPALQTRLAAEKGLHPFAASDAISPELDELVFQATRSDVNERLESAEAFLLFLDTPEQKVAEATLPTAELDPLQARPGDELPGGWVVRRVLGTGSTARALLVESLHDRDDDVEVRQQVLKVALDGVKGQRLEAEAETLRKVGGGSIIRLYRDPLMIADRTVLDLEFAGEQSLGAQLRAEGRLSYHDLERFGGDLFAALKELAAHGVRHRDIKPDNLGVQVRSDRSRQLKLFDFSLADVPDRDTSVGTRGYLDPFLGSVRRPAYDDHAERYAAAVTLYEMATGARLEWDFGGDGPLQSSVELPQIAADLFEPGLREGLSDFFARCLHRDVDHRFDTLDLMEAAWRAVFTTADAALPASTPATAALDRGTTTDEVAADPEAIEAARDAAVEVAELDTPLDAAGLSPRAVSVAHGLGATTVAQLIDIPTYQITRARGTGTRVRKELIRRHKQWTARLRPSAPPVAAHGTRVFVPDDPHGNLPVGDSPAVDIGTDWVPTVDQIVDLLTRPTGGRRSRRSEVVRAVLGLDDRHSGDGAWTVQSEIAATLKIKQPSVSRSYREALTTWASMPVLAAVRDDLVTIVLEAGRVMTSTELALALRGRRGCAAATPEAELVLASAVVRAAVDVEQRTDLPGRDVSLPDGDDRDAGDARLAALRRGGTMWIAAESLPGTDDPVPAELVSYAAKLGQVAEQLAAGDPLPGKLAVVRALRGVEPPEGMAPLPETRLVGLAAVAAPTPVAVSSRLELYSPDLSLDRALRISQAATALRTPASGPDGGARGPGLTQKDLLTRVQGRFPEIRLPGDLTYRTIWRALDEAGFKFTYDVPEQRFVPPPRTVSASSRTATAFGRGDTAGPLTTDQVPALTKLGESLERGGFVALTVRGRRMGTVADDLARRFAVARVDLDALFLTALRGLVAERGQDWSKVLANDVKFAQSRVAGRGFASYLRTAWQRCEADLHELYRPGEVLFVHDAGLLGRYWDDGGHDLLVALQGAARRPGDGPHGLWLLCPGETAHETPRLGGHIVEVLGDHEVAALDSTVVAHLADHAA
jgi:serine/threonine protein kinase